MGQAGPAAWRAMALSAVAVATFSTTSCAWRTTDRAKEMSMKQALSPEGDTHPGNIVVEDRVTGQTRTEKASDVPPGFAWVRVGDRWEPVVRIVITGTPNRRCITKYGRDGKVLETTIQAPPRARPQ